MKASPPITSASALLGALRAGPFPADAYAWMYEVSNGTGWHGNRRRADAIVLQCWPSRGIALTGFEVKVARADWVREFRHPAKAEEIRKWCAYWYLVAPSGVINLDEVPKAWGLYEVAGKSCSRVKEAPEHKTEPLDLQFIASIMRNLARQQDAIRNAAREEGYDAARKRFDKGGVAAAEKELEEARSVKYRLERELDGAKQSYTELKHAVAAFEKAAGLHEGAISAHRSYMGLSPVGDYYKLAVALSQRPIDGLLTHFREAVAACEAIAALEKGAACSS